MEKNNLKLKSAISPSLMCADLVDLNKYIKEFEKNKIEYLHIDIMDGDFVPNFTFGTDFCRILKQSTSIPLDLHLMINEPERKLDWFEFGEDDIVSVHYESTKHICRTLQIIKARGAKALVALNPGTTILVCEPLLEIIDGVLLMTVNPGCAGGQMIQPVLNKIEKLRLMLNGNGYGEKIIEVDGNVSFENAVKMREKGADVFVAGSSSIFCKNKKLSESIAKFRSCIF